MRIVCCFDSFLIQEACAYRFGSVHWKAVGDVAMCVDEQFGNPVMVSDEKAAETDLTGCCHICFCIIL